MLQTILKTLVFTLFTFPLISQEVETIDFTVDDQMETRDNTAEKIKSLDQILTDYNSNPNPNLAVEIANRYSDNQAYFKSVEWYRKGRKSVESDPATALKFAFALRKTQNFTEAVELLEGLMEEGQFVAVAADQLYDNQELLRVSLLSDLYDYESLPFNTRLDENYVTRYRNKILIASNKTRSKKIKKKMKHDYYDLIQLNREYGQWRTSEFLIPEAGPYFNRGNASYNEDGNKVFFSLSPYLKPKKRKKLKEPLGTSQLYMATNFANNWIDTFHFDFNSSSYSCQEPTVNSAGTVLYFSSDMPGGYGGFDIYQSRLIDGQWSDPENLGNLVNTPADERMPFLRKNKELYFSSDRNSGFGGFDIYISKKSQGQWRDVEVLPPPINSLYDEMSIVYEPNDIIGYFSSNRPGGRGQNDIYELRPFNLPLAVHVVSDSTNEGLGFTELLLSKNGVEIEQKMTNKVGDAVFQLGKNADYELRLYKDGYDAKTLTVSSKSYDHNDQISIREILNFNEDYLKEQDILNNGLVTYKAKVIDGEKQPVKDLEIRMINPRSRRMKILTTDDNGEISQDLFLGNNYKVFILHNGTKIEEDISTLGMKGNQVINGLFEF